MWLALTCSGIFFIFLLYIDTTNSFLFQGYCQDIKTSLCGDCLSALDQLADLTANTPDDNDPYRWKDHVGSDDDEYFDDDEEEKKRKRKEAKKKKKKEKKEKEKESKS